MAAAFLEPSQVVERIREMRLIPVIVIEDAERAVPLARALVEGGLRCIEITFRTARAADAIARINAEVPEMLVGAGTVLTPEQARAARDSGAQFVVAPGFNPRVVDYCVHAEIPMFPGVCTPSDIEAALERELRVLKFFPAEPAGGLTYLKAIAAPYGAIDFIPTGGINTANLGPYLAHPRVIACGGSWVAPTDWIAAAKFDRIREETEKAVRVIGSAREPAPQ